MLYSFPAYTVTCLRPLATPSADQALLPWCTKELPSAENVVAEPTLEPQVNAPLTTPQLPLLLDRVKPSSERLAVKVAQVPLVYHVPAEMMQPFWLPLATTFRKPLPLKVPPEEVGAEPPEVVVGADEPPVVEGEGDALDLGRYFMPVLGHVDEEPMGSEGTKVPVCTEPRTLKKYQISFKAPLWQPRCTSLPPWFLDSAAWICAVVYVALELGTIPASDNHS